MMEFHLSNHNSVLENKDKSNGIVIELNIHFYDQLVQNYRNLDNVRTLNLAIHNTKK